MSKNISVITRLTIRELLAGRVLYILSGISAVFFFCLSLLSYFDESEQIKVLQDMGLTMCSFFAFMMLLFSLPLVLHAGEQKDKDVLFLVRAISRGEYLWGRIFGVFVTMFTSLSVLVLIVIVTIMIQCGSLSGNIFVAFYLMLIKYIVFASVLVVLCVSVDTLMVYFVGVVIFFLANGMQSFETVARAGGNMITAGLAASLKFVLPRFDYFTIVEAITLNKSVPFMYLLKVTGYAAIYAMIMFVIAHLIYRKKDF